MGKVKHGEIEAQGGMRAALNVAVVVMGKGAGASVRALSGACTRLSCADTARF